MLLVEFVYGWFVLPQMFVAIKATTNYWVYIYVYPLVDLLVEMVLDTTLILINQSQLLYFDVYLFLIGLQFGTAMTITYTNVEFWYLCVVYVLRLVNTRKQFIAGLLRKCLSRLAFLNVVVQKRPLHYKSGFLTKF